MPQAMTYRTDENERKNVFRAFLVGPCIHPADPASTADFEKATTPAEAAVRPTAATFPTVPNADFTRSPNVFVWPEASERPFLKSSESRDIFANSSNSVTFRHFLSA